MTTPGSDASLITEPETSTAGTIVVPGTIAGFADGERIGHFTILERLGKGGMGVVFAAYDADLDRKVALKVLRADAWGEEAQVGRQRLRREAQAMARLSHPNVVGVHEVGTVGDQLFVAMEHVDGRDLTTWLDEKKRSWQDIVSVFVSAGRGLAAAHAAGMVHRDFKPDNVLIDAHDRARVTDFGLVHVERASSLPATPDANEIESTGSWDPDLTLTRQSRRIGTPAFMAPEQHNGEPTDTRSDQFSFCVSLYRALYGKPPYAGTSYSELARNVRRGRRDPVPDDSDTPSWVLAVLERGLRIAPDERYPAMDALLRDLTNDPAVVWRRRAVLGGLAMAVSVVTALAVLGMARGAAPSGPQCDGGKDKLDAVWGDDARGKLQQAFVGTRVAYASGTHVAVAAALARYASTWTAARTDACEATHVRGEQSESMLDLRMRCLDRRLGEMAALIHVFETSPDRRVVSGAVRAVTRLTDVSVCADASELAATVARPASPQQSRSLRALERRVDAAVALNRAGKYKQAYKRIAAMEAEVRTLAYGPLLAELLYAKAVAQEVMDPTQTEGTLLETARVAAASHRDRVLAKAQIDLAWHLTTVGRHDAAATVATASEALVLRSGNPPVVRALRLHTLGRARARKGEHTVALRHLEQALVLYRGGGPPHSFDVAALLNSLAGVHQKLSHHAKSRTLYRESLSISESLLGRQHPNVAITRGNLCYATMLEGDHAAAHTCYVEAIKILSDANGVSTPDVAWALNDLGILLIVQKRYPAARKAFRRALAIWTNKSGREHSDAVWTHLGMAEVAIAQHDYREALRHCTAAEATQPAVRRALGPEDAYYLACIGRAHLGLRAPNKALPPLAKAMTLVARGVTDADVSATVRFALARALWPRKRERARALALAVAARSGWLTVGKSAHNEIAESTRWLVTRGHKFKPQKPHK